jgi:hypothetical protein
MKTCSFWHRLFFWKLLSVEFDSGCAGDHITARYFCTKCTREFEGSHGGGPVTPKFENIKEWKEIHH